MTDERNRQAEKAPPSVTVKDYAAPDAPDWCRGCGDFGILRALQKALADLALPPASVMVFGGIGCSGKTPYYLRANGVHTLHGRVLPFAAGAKLANPALTVIAAGGDGDGLSIGAGHFVNAGRRNLDLTYLFYNNEVYGLTKGQAAPTLPEGAQTRGMAAPNPQRALDPIRLALVAGYTWIGRGYAYAVEELADLVRQAIAHPGLAFLEILQPCPHYYPDHDKAWFAERLYRPADHDPHLRPGDGDARRDALHAAVERLARERDARLPVGVFLADTATPPFAAALARMQPAWPQRAPATTPIADDQGHPLARLDGLLDRFAV